MGTKSFKDLIVWQKARDLAISVYGLTDKFPRTELYGLTSQMRRAVISVSSNIAESYHRFHSKEKRQFLAIAFGSGSELESQIEIAKILFRLARSAWKILILHSVRAKTKYSLNTARQSRAGELASLIHSLPRRLCRGGLYFLN